MPQLTVVYGLKPAEIALLDGPTLDAYVDNLESSINLSALCTWGTKK